MAISTNVSLLYINLIFTVIEKFCLLSFFSFISFYFLFPNIFSLLSHSLYLPLLCLSHKYGVFGKKFVLEKKVMINLSCTHDSLREYNSAPTSLACNFPLSKFILSYLCPVHKVRVPFSLCCSLPLSNCK